MAYTGKQIAEKINIAPSTVRAWSAQFKIPYDKKQGKSVYSEDALNLVRTIKSLKDNLSGNDTIRRTIRADMNEHELTQHFISDENSNGIQANDNSGSQDITHQISKALKENNDLAEKYAKATYTIGQLENEIKHLESQVKALPSPVEVNNLQRDLENYKKEVEQLRLDKQLQSKEIEALKQESNLSPWQKLKRLMSSGL